jgi:3D (Asp-Asp-Asp) domain-containing protein/peptidoglycan hydrolase CwlO-like protein
VRASCNSRPARAALAGVAALLALLVSGAARADDPAGRAARLRADNASLATQSQQVLLQLYSLESRLRQAERRVAALEARSEELERARLAAENRLEIAKANMAAAHDQLGRRLRQLYVEGEVDPLAVLLGAESFDDALAALDGLNRLAEQDTLIIEQLTSARAELKTALARLAGRRADLDEALADAKAAQASLRQTQAKQSAYLASLRRQQDLNRSQIASLAGQAAESEQRSQELTSGGGSTSGPPPPPPPPPASGTKMTVSSTGYCLQGTTATGIPVSWGVVAVDPSVIPLGTRMFVPGYGEGVAADTGSAVQGAMIDLWFPSCADAVGWGRKTVTITIH